MRFIAVRDFRTRSSKIWQELSKEKEMVITSNGKPIAVISSVSEDNLEESLSAFRRARAINAVTKIQKRSVELGTDRMTLDEIDQEIRAVRAGRRK
jgi:prevent-host-death family protein